jgi:hypothetical protein
MSRSGYTDDCDDNWGMICWAGAVKSAINGRRGQTFLTELRDALDAMPDKRLIADELVADGAYCALGVIGARRGVAVETLDPDDAEQVAKAFDISPTLAREIVFANDDDFGYRNETPEQRWSRVRRWVASQIKETP